MHRIYQKPQHSMRVLSVVLFLGVAAYALSESCPSDEEISPCTSKCSRREITIKCINNRISLEELKLALEKIPKEIGITLQLEGLQLGKFPSNFWNEINIINIQIEKCKIDNFADYEPDFTGLRYTLEELSIISSLTDEERPVTLTIGYLQTLKKLKLNQNTINHLTNDFLPDKQLSLETIDLESNGIRTLGRKVFTHLYNTRELILRGNCLTYINRAMLPIPADQLVTLDLSNNSLTELPPDLFFIMPILKNVNLQNNTIALLDEAPWVSVWEQLDNVELQGNPLECDADMRWMFKLKKPNTLSGKCVIPWNTTLEMSLTEFIRKNGSIYR